MTCQDIRAMIHEYLDGELPANQVPTLENHLQHCPSCLQECEDLRWTKAALGLREQLPPAAQEYVWRQIHLKAGLSWRIWLADLWEAFQTYWRDVDRPLIWSKIYAVPVTLAFFITITMQFPIDSVQEWTYTAITMRRLPYSVFMEPLMTQVQVRYSPSDLDGIMNASWKLPYEDSFSLVAQITPEGHAQIQDVLEYPKSRDLLEAAGVTLRSSEFETAQNHDNPRVIFNYQKIDVYGDHPGL